MMLSKGISIDTIHEITGHEHHKDKQLVILVNGIQFPVKAIRGNKDSIILVPYLQQDIEVGDLLLRKVETNEC